MRSRRVLDALIAYLALLVGIGIGLAWNGRAYQRGWDDRDEADAAWRQRMREAAAEPGRPPRTDSRH